MYSWAPAPPARSQNWYCVRVLPGAGGDGGIGVGSVAARDFGQLAAIDRREAVEARAAAGVDPEPIDEGTTVC